MPVMGDSVLTATRVLANILRRMRSLSNAPSQIALALLRATVISSDMINLYTSGNANSGAQFLHAFRRMWHSPGETTSYNTWGRTPLQSRQLFEKQILICRRWRPHRARKGDDLQIVKSMIKHPTQMLKMRSCG
jgi:hypothetical protein